jgi:uncharacterized protein YecT (DUF1311 family)
MNRRYNSFQSQSLFVRRMALQVSLLVSIAQMHAQPQAAMNAQARAEFVRADAEPNKTYQALLAKLRDTDSKQKLKETQRAWITSRDADAAHAADEAGGGSMAPTLRYETMTELTRQRIKELKDTLAGDTSPNEKDGSTPSPTSIATASASAQELDKEPAAATPNPSSVSPDKKWEYVGGDEPKIVKAGTNEVPLDLSDEAPNATILWAPDSKRFALNYGQGKLHETSFYQLRGHQWEELESSQDVISQRVGDIVAAQLKKKGLSDERISKKGIAVHHIWSKREVDRWTNSNTAILYASEEEVIAEEGFGYHLLFTLRFDESGNCKIIKPHRMSEKEVEERGE